jgi:hypothetical protein
MAAEDELRELLVRGEKLPDPDFMGVATGTGSKV